MKTTHAVLGGAALIAVSVLGSAYIIVQKIDSFEDGVEYRLRDIVTDVNDIRRGTMNR